MFEHNPAVEPKPPTSPSSATSTPERVVRLTMNAKTFDEERILEALLKTVKAGGSITTRVPRDDGDAEVTEFVFEL